MSLALMATRQLPYPLFAAGMVLAGTGAGLLNGETAKAMQGSLPAQRSGMASGLSATVRFSALLFGVAGLGAVLISQTAARFVAGAADWNIDAATASSVAKRFVAGDAGGAARDALRRSFDSGFGAAAWTAAAVAIAAMLLTR